MQIQPEMSTVLCPYRVLMLCTPMLVIGQPQGEGGAPEPMFSSPYGQSMMTRNKKRLTP